MYSFNLFKEGLFIDDAETLLHGWRKSIIFVVVYAISAAAAITYTSLMPVTVQQTLFNPTLEQYLAIEQYAPSCACSRPTFWQDAARLTFPPEANMSTNLCGAIQPIYYDTLALVVNKTTQLPHAQEIAVLLAYLRFDLVSCADVKAAQDATAYAIRGGSLDTLLLPPVVLQARVYRDAVSALQQMQLVIQTVLTSSLTSIFSYSLAPFDLSVNATNRSPANCSCNLRDMAASPPSPLQSMFYNGGCTFHAPFDWRTNGSRSRLDPDSMWSCNLVSNAYYMPVELFDTPLYEYIGLPPPYDRYSYTPTPSADNMAAVWQLPSMLTFASTPESGTDFNVLQPGIVTSDYNAYFAKCAPASCTFTRSGRPPPITAINTSLGIVSGLQTVLMLLVGYGYMMIIRRKTAAPNT
ncbi:MAG: hypothetical protein EOO65_05445, partial [Methanosarcinales archaeon]